MTDAKMTLTTHDHRELYRTSRIHELRERMVKLDTRIQLFQDDGFAWVLKFTIQKKAFFSFTRPPTRWKMMFEHIDKPHSRRFTQNIRETE